MYAAYQQHIQVKVFNAFGHVVCLSICGRPMSCLPGYATQHIIEKHSSKSDLAEQTAEACSVSCVAVTARFANLHDDTIPRTSPSG